MHEYLITYDGNQRLTVLAPHPVSVSLAAFYALALRGLKDASVQSVALDQPEARMNVVIPFYAEHGGFDWNTCRVTLRAFCPVCGGRRGAPHDTLSFDGSRRLNVSGWSNPCGHIDSYSAVLQEASSNGLNPDLKV